MKWRHFQIEILWLKSQKENRQRDQRLKINWIKKEEKKKRKIKEVHRSIWKMVTNDNVICDRTSFANNIAQNVYSFLIVTFFSVGFFFWFFFLQLLYCYCLVYLASPERALFFACRPVDRDIQKTIFVCIFIFSKSCTS